MKPRRRHITSRERAVLKRFDSERQLRNRRIRGALLERDRLKVLLLEKDLTPAARTDIETALKQAQETLDALCVDPNLPLELRTEKNADLGNRPGDRVDDDAASGAEVESDADPENSAADELDGLSEGEGEGEPPVPLTKSHVGGGKWFVMRGDERVAGPFKKDEIDVELEKAAGTPAA